MSRWLTQSELRRKKMLDYLKIAANISSLTVFSQQLDLVESLFQNEICANIRGCSLDLLRLSGYVCVKEFSLIMSSIS